MSVESDRLRKQLITQKQKLDADIKADKVEIAEKQKELASKRKRAAGLDQKIKELEAPKGIRVTEHALLRYFERVLGYDMDEISAKIL